MVAGRERAAPKRARLAGTGRLARTVSDVREQLVRAALSAGLHLVRPRSVPDRLMHEAHGFVALIVTTLRARSRRAAEQALEEQVRRGAFACCDVDQAREVFEVWRDVLRSFVAGHPGLVDGDDLERALAGLAARLDEVVARVAGERIDIIVAGGSAGGITALRALLGPLAADLPATVLAVLHTSERSPLVMPQVLGGHTALPIAYPVERGRLLLGHVYIAPPGRHLAVREERMRLLDTPPVSLCRPSIDVLFTTAAQSFGARVASVLLSGTGRDGAAGTQAVRARGGATYAQSPADAEFGVMPAAAIGTGAVQQVAAAAVIGRELARRVAG